MTRRTEVNQALENIEHELNSGRVKYVKLSARSFAIETALKLSNATREKMGGISSVIWPSLQYCKRVNDSGKGKDEGMIEYEFMNVDSEATLRKLISLPVGKINIYPVIEILLSSESSPLLNPADPGYQEHSIKI